MPDHNCPFDILQGEYYVIGYPFYLALFGAPFNGTSSAVVSLFSRCADLAAPFSSHQRTAVGIATALLLLYTILVTFPCVRYVMAGGEV